MRLALVALLVTIAGPAAALADTVVPGGDVVNQTWTAAGSPYRVQDDIQVPAGAFLRIEEGVEVIFPHWDADGGGQWGAQVELNVHGALYVNGTAERPVHMHADPIGTWEG